MPNIFVYNLGTEIGRGLWLGLISDLLSTGVVDGVFPDKYSVYASPNSSVASNDWKICNHWCAGITRADAIAFNKGKNITLGAAMALLGPDPLFFNSSNTDFIKHTREPEGLIEAIGAHLAANKYAYVVAARDQQPDHDPADITSNCTETVVAVFLLAVEEGAFLGCNGCM